MSCVLDWGIPGTTEDAGIILKTGQKGPLFPCSGAEDQQPDPSLPDKNLESYAEKENKITITSEIREHIAF